MPEFGTRDRARYTLPNVINPPRRCITIEVPDNIYHLAAFYGQIVALGRAYSWGDDSAHTALSVAKVWREVYDSIRRCGDICTGTAGADGEDNLIRQNPDNPCELQTSIDGTHWCTFADLSLCIPAGNQPGSGTPQPPANGGQACYHASFEGSNKWLLPTLVNAGDVVQISNAHGAASDGTVVWYCPNGAVFQLGACFGSGTTSGGDPLNTSPHMMLIAKIGSTYYPMYNTSFTVPGGVSAASVEFQLNDSNLADNYGNITFDACVTNNAAGTWTHTFDFTLGDGGWTTQPGAAVGTPGQYTPGVGWQGDHFQNPAGSYYNGVYIQKTFAARTLTQVQMFYDLATKGTNQTTDNHQLQIWDSAGSEVYLTYAATTNGNGQVLSWLGSRAGITSLNPTFWSSFYNSATYSGQITIAKVVVSGIGTDPF